MNIEDPPCAVGIGRPYKPEPPCERIPILTLDEKLRCLQQLSKTIRKNMNYFPKWKRNEVREVVEVKPHKSLESIMKKKYHQEAVVLRRQILQIRDPLKRNEHLRMLREIE